MTAGALTDDRAACLAAGMDFFLTKPIRMPELSGLLAQVRATAAARESSTTSPGTAAPLGR